MARHKRHKEPPLAKAPQRRRIPWRRVLIGTSGVIALLLLLLAGPRFYGQWCRTRAAADLDVWALTDAQQWLQRAAWLEPHSADTALLQAQAFRQLRDERACAEWLQRAEGWGAPRGSLLRERTLAQIQSGELGDQASSQFQSLVASGASPHDVSASFVSGALARKDLALATQLLDAWDHDLPNHPQAVFLRGAWYAITGDRAKARAAFDRALLLEPRHDLARLALAQTAEAEHRVELALVQYKPLIAAHPENELVASGYARCLRKSGRLAEAKAILEPLAARADASPDVKMELISNALERGDYAAARQGLDQLDGSRIVDDDALTVAGITLSMLGETIAADHLIVAKFNRQAAQSLVDDLQTRAAMQPFDGAVAAQLQTAGRQFTELSNQANLYESALSQADPQAQDLPEARQLFVRHCESCHGSNGGGDGVAARHVFPRPRDLRRESMRLVSTTNGIASGQDLVRVIEKGIAGTAMVPLPGLSAQQTGLLVDTVLSMRREGVREQYLAQFAPDEAPDEADVKEAVALRTTPAAPITPPELDQPDAARLQLGKRLYAEQACLSCHGETGTGDPQMPLFDTLGRPCFPRDLVHDPFKGDNQAGAIYQRILLGMPGTPHPATINLNQAQAEALTYYCHSLGKSPKQVFTNHQRAVQAWRRPAVQWTASAP